MDSELLAAEHDSTIVVEVVEEDSMEQTYTLSMDPASLGLVMEEVQAGTEIPWQQEVGVSTENVTPIDQLICRICAEQNAELIPVFEGKGIELQLPDKMRWHLPITISKDDKLPLKVCQSCVKRLDSCHELANLCLESEERLAKLFQLDGITDFEEKYSTSEAVNTGAIRRSKRTPLPTERLIKAMKQLRKAKKGDSASTVSSYEDSSSEPFEAVYLDDVTLETLDERQVLDVTIEPGEDGAESLPAGQWKTANLRVKMPKDFADCDTTLKSQIVGAIQDIMIEEDQSSGKTKLRKSAASGRGGEREWKCDICGHVAPRKSSLLVHQRRNHAKAFACSYCYKTFSNGVARRHHELAHIPQTIVADNQVKAEPSRREFICEVCGKVFKRHKSLIDHNLSHHTEEKPFRCDKCDRAYGSQVSLDIHKSTHSSELPYLCDLCGKKFKHVSNLRSHKRSHLVDEKKNTQVCQICGKGFRSRFHLNEHLNVHLNKKPYACDKCDKRFHKKIQLRQHGSTHSGTQPFKCHVCGVRFNRRGNMTQHLKRHDRLVKFTCKVCQDGFDTLSNLLHHRKTHTQAELDDAVMRQVAADGEVTEAFKCEICNKLLAKKDSLVIHMRSHSGEKLFPCEVCGKKLSNKGSLTYHMRSYHTGERPYSCQFCADMFLTREACSVHERIHTGEKPYTCTVCMMGFRCSSNLAQHVRVHSNDRPHQCDHCEKTFLRKGALTVHMRTHTGERPYICDQCGRAFTQKNDMLKHRRTHTQEKPFECIICGMMFGQKRELTKHQAVHMEVGDQQTVVITATSDDQLLQSFTAEIIDSSLINVFHKF